MLIIAFMMIVFVGFARAEDTYGALVSMQGKTFKFIDATDWSPDGKWITFAAQGRSSDDPSGQYEFGPISDIWLVPSEGGAVKNLTLESENSEYRGNYAWPNFTCEGSEVTYSKVFNFYEGDVRKQVFTIESIDINTGEFTDVLEENSRLGFWSDDGKYIVYIDMTDDPVYDNIDDYAFIVLEYDSDGEVYNQTFPQGQWPQFEMSNSCISPDNTNFLTTLLENEGNNGDDPSALYKFSLDSGESETLISEGSPWYPRYSPDGKWILYTNWYNNGSYTGTNYGPYPAQFAQLCVYKVESGEITVLMPDCPYWNHYGCWSPYGDKICYILQKAESSELRIIDFEFAENSPDIQANVGNESPEKFAINGNYPNPFNPATTIEFSLPEAGFVGLVIYNVTGQKVRELLTGSMTPGIHTVTWDGLDDRGLAVSAGVYVTRLRMNDAVAAGRMTLIK